MGAVTTMESKHWYFLSPPAMNQGKIFNRVFCECRFPSTNEYLLYGVPLGGEEEQVFHVEVGWNYFGEAIPCDPVLRVVK